MNRRGRLNYIFATHPRNPIQNRFDWIDAALLGDIQTFVDGIQRFVKKKQRPTPTKPRGGGNASLPILTNTGLELVSAMFVGDTKYRNPHGYDAEENVVRFITSYFPGNSARIAHLLWDGTRNGLIHLFTPKVVRRRRDYIQFSFYVDDYRIPSYIERKGRIIVIMFNSIEYYKVLKRAISTYKTDLQKRRELQLNFIRAWRSIEGAVRNLDRNQAKKPEADFIRKSLRRRSKVTLFQYHV